MFTEAAETAATVLHFVFDHVLPTSVVAALCSAFDAAGQPQCNLMM